MKINFDETSNSSITVNGTHINVSGSSVVINKHGVFVDGYKQDSNVGNGPLTITINGNVKHIDTMSGDVIVHGDVSSVKTMSGDVTANHITANIDTMSGDVITKHQ